MAWIESVSGSGGINEFDIDNPIWTYGGASTTKTLTIDRSGKVLIAESGGTSFVRDVKLNGVAKNYNLRVGALSGMASDFWLLDVQDGDSIVIRTSNSSTQNFTVSVFYA